MLAGQVKAIDTQRQLNATETMRFASHLRVQATDGKVANTKNTLTVTNASHATLVVTAATNFVNYRKLAGDPIEKSRAQLEAVSSGWPSLLSEHVADHRRLYDRVNLRIGTPTVADAPTDQRILMNADQADPTLATLLFNYGRYLMIASSRPGSQPANLQGVWNEELQPRWESKYTTNINTEMNYWLVDPCNLDECAEPLFELIKEVSESGKRVAEEHYAAPGWVLHHNTDLWRGAAPINASNHGIWPTGGAWLCHHLWEHYLYTRDQQFLRETAYPLMRGAAEFFAEYLVEDPRTGDHWLISGPSNSPEQGGLVMGPTMDHQILRSLFANTIEAANVLAIDAELQGELAELRARIAPNKVGQHGQLQEWLEDVDQPDNKHRHVSHLWGLHPGSEITPDSAPLFAAARKSLEMRGDGGTGWSRAWKVNFWARLRDGNRSHRVLQGLLTLTGSPLTDYRGGGVYPNLLDAHPPFQIDGNFGATSGICEMFVQSHRRLPNAGGPLIELLPALPDSWPSGRITGLRSRGAFEVDVEWSDGALKQCHLRSLKGGPAALQYKGHRVDVNMAAGEQCTLDEQLRVW